MQPDTLGVGIVWWPALDPLCRTSEGLVDVIEAEPETFWTPAADGQGFRSFLGEALQHLSQPKLLHGVGSPLGGTCAPPARHAETLEADIACVRPAYVSEHLSLTRFRPKSDALPASAGFMLPPLQSRVGVELAASNIRRHRAAIGGLPLAVETSVSYLPMAPGEWPDGDFVSAVAEAADCGILLDLHNVLCNARNGRQSVKAFCDSLPLSRVWELHLAGGEYERGFYLDAHAGVVGPELMEIAAALLPRLPNLRAIIFEVTPERVADVGLAALAAQIGRMKDLWSMRPSGSVEAPLAVHRCPRTEPPIRDPELWETLLGCAINGLPHSAIPLEAAEWWRSAGPALNLYRSLVGEGRASAIAAAAPETTRLLLRHYGGPRVREIFAEYWRENPPAYTSADEAKALVRFLAQSHADLPGLKAAIAADATVLVA